MEFALECIGIIAIITASILALVWIRLFVESVHELQRDMEQNKKLREQFWELRWALKYHINGNDDAAKAALDKAGGL